MKYFDYATGLKMTNSKFSSYLDAVRNSKDLLTQFHMDISASIQSVTEEIILKITKNISSKYKINNLCLAGGVALNCVANGKIIKKKYLITFGYNQQQGRWFIRCRLAIGTMS